MAIIDPLKRNEAPALKDFFKVWDERYEYWGSIFVSVVASKGVRAWWEERSGRLGFQPKARNLIDQKLNDTENPPTLFNEIWELLNSESWRSAESNEVAAETQIETLRIGANWHVFRWSQ